jgi:predicted anti-sigma-YlaC factor YlaD
MSCETAQEQVSLLIDAELEGSAQAKLFGHLEGCSECRSFFDSMVRFRKAAHMDREEIFLAASEVLPPRSPVPRSLFPAREHRFAAGWTRWLRAGSWRMPVPAGVGLAIVLLFAGALLGARLASISRGSGMKWTAGETAKPTVVVVCGLPEVEVHGTGSLR